MLALEDSVRTRTEDVVAKVLDGEALIMNVSTGVYYNIANSGAFMWAHLEAGCRLQDIAAAVVRRYGIEQELAEADVLGLAAKLIEEKVVEPRSDASPSESVDTNGIPPSAYESPKVEIYRDIGHLVALDPPMPGLKDLPWKGPTDESSS